MCRVKCVCVSRIVSCDRGTAINNSKSTPHATKPTETMQTGNILPDIRSETKERPSKKKDQ